MKVTFPSGGTAELRDTLLRGDSRDARRAIEITTSPDGTQTFSGAMRDNVAGRLIARMLVAWDRPDALPSSAATESLRQGILDKLTDEDYGELEDAVAPWVRRVMGTDAGRTFTHLPSGVTVLAGTRKDAETLAGHPDFEAADAGDAAPKSEPSATSS